MTFRRVLVGVDFSAASLAAARWVATQFAPHAELMLAHVLPEPEAAPFLRPYLPPMLGVVAEVAPALLGGLCGLADLIGASRTRVGMFAGPPADGLARAAAEFEADLVCLGRTHSRRGGARFGATTAHRLLARSDVPLLVVPAARGAAPARVLAALDGHSASSAVLDAAVSFARGADATLDALHVLGPELRALVHACRWVEPAEEREARLRLAGDLDGAVRLRDEAHLVEVTRGWVEAQLRGAHAPPSRAHPHVRVGDPGQEIVAFAHATNVDLVVVGRGGEIPAGRDAELAVWAPGSTARLVMWAAPCPVLVASPGVESKDQGSPPRAMWRRRSRTPALGVRAHVHLDPAPLPPAAALRSEGTGGPHEAA